MLTSLPLWLSAILLIVVPTLAAMAGPIVVRRFVRLDSLRTNNEVAGFKFATVGVLYAVLLAFAVIVVWEKFNESDRVVAKEAGAATAIYRLANGIAAEPRTALREALTAYLHAAIDKDWPAMAQGHASADVTEALNRVYATLLHYHADDGIDTVIAAEIFHQLDGLTEARRSRLVASTGIVPRVVWMVLIGGAVITMGFTFFFGTENLHAQTLMTGALSVLIFSGLLTVVAIDRPFTGSVKVTPEALHAVLEDFAPGTRPQAITEAPSRTP